MSSETLTTLSPAPAWAVMHRVPAWVVPMVRVAWAAADAVWAAAAFMLAFHWREAEPLLNPLGTAWSEAFAPYAVLLPFVVAARLGTAAYYRLYRVRGEFDWFEEIVKLFKAIGLGSLLIVAAAFLYRGGFEFRAFSYARAVFALDFALACLGCGVLRVAARTTQIALRQRGVNLIPTFVVGRGPEAAQCIEEMRARPALGYRVVGVVAEAAGSGQWAVGSGQPAVCSRQQTAGSAGSQSANAAPALPTAGCLLPATFAGVPVVCDVRALPEAIRAAGVNEVIVTDAQLAGDELFDVMMRVGRRRGVEFRIAPNLFNLVPRKTEIDQIGALPMIRLFREPLSDAARIVKRGSDLIIASVALILLAPLWFVIALITKLDSSGPVFYRQERVGMDGRIFLFIKFRTMRADSDDRIHREYQEKLIAGDTAQTNLGDDTKPVFKLANDPRITRIGRILRRLSLDEMPQLLNVLRGDMSIVGPRPPIPYEVENYALWHRKRLDMKPGITGLWQVSGRNRLSFEEMVRLDLYYIENWSLWLDVKIICKTLPVMLKGQDAY